MSAENLLFHDTARAKLCDGFNTLADAVEVTLGPRGRAVVLGNCLGAQLVREVSARTSETAGDGVTTATVPAQTLVRQGMKFVAAGFDPIDPGDVSGDGLATLVVNTLRVTLSSIPPCRKQWPTWRPVCQPFPLFDFDVLPDWHQ